MHVSDSALAITPLKRRRSGLAVVVAIVLGTAFSPGFLAPAQASVLTVESCIINYLKSTGAGELTVDNSIRSILRDQAVKNATEYLTSGSGGTNVNPSQMPFVDDIMQWSATGSRVYHTDPYTADRACSELKSVTPPGSVLAGTYFSVGVATTGHSAAGEAYAAVIFSWELSPSPTTTTTTTTTTPPTTTQPRFEDVPSSHTFVQGIDRLADAGITKGCNPPNNTRFCPDDFVTRGQMAAFLTRALGLTGESSGFSDTRGHTFETAVERIAAEGITKGCNPPANTRFCPDEYVTRGQMAAFLVRALSLPAYTEADRFTDDNGNIFEDAIERLAQAGITKGCNPDEGNTRFCPDDFVTRGQMAAFLVRAGLAG